MADEISMVKEGDAVVAEKFYIGDTPWHAYGQK